MKHSTRAQFAVALIGLFGTFLFGTGYYHAITRHEGAGDPWGPSMFFGAVILIGALIAEACIPWDDL